MRYLLAVAVLSVGCFSKPTFEGRNDANPGSDSAIIDGSITDGPSITSCDWLGTPGLLAYLKFDDGSGVQAADTSGMTNHGTLMGGTWTAGKLGGALTLTGNQLVNLGSASSLDNIRAMTACAWINLDQIPLAAATIADKSTNGFVGGWNMYVQQNPDSPLGFLSNDGYAVYGSQPIGAGQWTHVCASWDGSTGYGGIQLYINGMRINSLESTFTAPMDPSDASNNLILGRASGVDNYHLDGALDEFVLFDHVLSAAEIQVIYACAG